MKGGSCPQLHPLNLPLDDNEDDDDYDDDDDDDDDEVFWTMILEDLSPIYSNSCLFTPYCEIQQSTFQGLLKPFAVNPSP